MRTYDTPLGELPSVTTILDVVSEPFLIPWVKKEARVAAVEAVLTLKEAGSLRKKGGIDRDTLEDVIKEAIDSHTRIAKTATDIGSIVHGAIEFLVKERGYVGGEYSEEELDDIALLGYIYGSKVSDMLQAFRALLLDNSLRIIQSETTVYSQHGFAGTLDLILEDEYNKLYVADIKTSKRSGKDFPTKKNCMQVEAYRYALNESCSFNRAQGSMIIRLDKQKPEKSEIGIVPYNARHINTFLQLLGVFNYVRR